MFPLSALSRTPGAVKASSRTVSGNQEDPAGRRWELGAPDAVGRREVFAAAPAYGLAWASDPSAWLF